MTPLDPASAAVRIGAAVRSFSTFVDDDQAAELLKRLADAAVECVPGADYCGVTVDVDGVPFAAAATSSAVVAVDTEQYDADQGPCLYAAREGETVLVDCTVTDPRWPAFGPAARDSGIAAMICTPVRLGGRAVGSLTLFAHAPHTFDDVDRDIIDTLVGAVEDVLDRQDRHHDLVHTISGLRDAMSHRAPIEQAKGILMALRGIDENAAFDVLATESQRTNRKVRDVAKDFVASATESGAGADGS